VSEDPDCHLILVYIHEAPTPIFTAPVAAPAAAAGEAYEYDGVGKLH
jgi:hypothetical protein